MKKALLWDFDGTLSHPNKSFFTALYTALCDYGYDINRSEAVLFLKEAYSWNTPQISYVAKTQELWWESLFQKIYTFCEKKSVLFEDRKKICGRLRDLIVDVNNYTLYEDAAETLKKCTEMGYKNYLITNNYPEIINNIKKLNISYFFTDYVVSSHIGYEKPRSEFFDYSKKIAGAPDVVYVIGDNSIADIQGGKKAGFTTIAVHDCKDSDADYYLENLSEIFLILN